MEEESFYYSLAGSSALGPCSLSELRVLWTSGHIGRLTPVWRDSMPCWLPIQDQPKLAAALLPLAQPPQVREASELWHCHDAASGKQRYGLTSQQLGLLLRAGEIDGLTLVWRSGMDGWSELGQVSELRSECVGGDEEGDDEHAISARQAIAAAQASEAYDPTAPVVEAPSAPPPPKEEAKATEGPVKPKRQRKNKPKFVQDGRSNAYVSGIPPTTSDEVLLEIFKIAGLIKTDPETGKPRIKRYFDERGRPKGDALICFLKPESVQLAVTLRDGYELEPGVALSVSPAKFELRGEPKLKAKALGKDAMLQRKKQRMLEQRQLAQWEDSLLTSADGKRQCTVIMFGLFAPEDAAEGPEFYSNLKQDVETESRKAGEVEKVTIFEGSERGVAAVRFKNADDAEKCVAMMHERQFGTNQLTCELFDGVSDYRVRPSLVGSSGPESGDAKESIEEQERKLEGFAEWLEAGSTDDELNGSGNED